MEGTSCSGVSVHRAVSSVSKVENSYSISVPIFKQFHKNIIGKGGANIKKVTLALSPVPFRLQTVRGGLACWSAAHGRLSL